MIMIALYAYIGFWKHILIFFDKLELLMSPPTPRISYEQIFPTLWKGATY